MSATIMATASAKACLPILFLIFPSLTFMEAQQSTPDGEILITLVRMKMPFGKYKGILLCDLPVSYLEWFAKKGFPQGKLGMLLATVYEIKLNGLSYLLEPLKKASENPHRR